MKIYLSSTQKDLERHRARVAEVLRQADNKVLYMEDYPAEESRPLDRCVAHVASANLYVGIFAWRYGFVPKKEGKSATLPPGVVHGKTSITEAEYHAAGQANIPRLIFLLADSEPWLPMQMDVHTGESDGGRRIAELRGMLRERHLVSFFTTPDNLANAVLAAVRRQDLSRKLELKTLQQADAHSWLMNPDPAPPPGLYDTTMMTITTKIQELDDETYMIVDIGTGRTWWSTRLYFLASLLVDLTDVRLLVFIDDKKRLFGVTSAVSLRNAFARRLDTLQDYESQLDASAAHDDLETELNRRGGAWETAMTGAGGEEMVKSWVRKQELRRYLGDALIQRSVEWPGEDEGRMAVLDVVDQVIKWPQDFVPIVRDDIFYNVVERDALTEEIAKIFVEDRKPK